MKAAIYCRLSEEDRNKLFETEDCGSIQNQKAMLVPVCPVSRGGSFTDIYSDDDYTGADQAAGRSSTGCLADAAAAKV